jgi:hypothetical protein
MIIKGLSPAQSCALSKGYLLYGDHMLSSHELILW